MSTKGASFSPLSGITNWKKSVFNPKVDLEQTKNVFTKGEFATDEYIKAEDAAAVAAGVAAAPTVTGTAAGQETLQAEQELRRARLAKMGLLSTIKAGETGGFRGLSRV